MKYILFFALAITAALARPSVPHDEVASAKTDEHETTHQSRHRGFLGYISFAGGYGDSAGSLNDKAEGAPSSLKLVGSYVTENNRGVFDSGFGLHNHNFVHTLVADKSISTGVMEFAARYQFKNHWQLGVVYNQAFNVGNNFYADQADVQFAGAQILREFAIANNYIGRIGGRFMNGLNIKNEVFNAAMVEIHLSWPTF